jgi:cyclopropane-fatty-acyl-phospholipid synthase
MAEEHPPSVEPFPGSAAPPTRSERRVLEAVIAGMGHPPVTVVLWNGEELRPPPGESLGRVRIRDRSVVRDFVRSPELAFGDAYADGLLEVEGDLAEFLTHTFRAGRESSPWLLALNRVLGWRPRSNTLRRSRENIHHHYDLGNEFYEIWLDERLVYTCAYFPTPETSLEEAQLAKMDHVCRKLVLKPGERVVEAGCGWGSLALHMAERYGVRVRAFNISSEQTRYARDKAREFGLEKQVEFVEDDYRSITGSYDAFVSVGMLEHVGKAHYATLGRIIDRCIVANGRGLLHFIGHPRPMPTPLWLERRIFPGGYMPSLTEALCVLEPRDLAVLDIENLRRHYALTLRHWLGRFEGAAERIERMYDERFVRIWRLYLASSRAAFESGSIQLWQVLFARSDDTTMPWTRSCIYE